MHREWIDVSVPVRTGMVHWPGDPAFRRSLALDMAAGDVCTVSEISLGVHTGTHMDAPAHFIREGADMDTLPLGAVVGDARVIEISDERAIRVEELERAEVHAGERLLFKTRNSERCWQTDAFIEDFVYVSHEAAAYLAARRVQTVGVDYLSVGGFHHDMVETHRALLGAGIWIIEGLNLAAIMPGRYELVCLPLKLAGAEGAPARAILRRAVV